MEAFSCLVIISEVWQGAQGVILAPPAQFAQDFGGEQVPEAQVSPSRQKCSVRHTNARPWGGEGGEI